MNDEHNSPEPTHSDIRLVDAAVILVRHWVAFFLGLLLVLVVGVFYAVTADDKYEFISLYQLAEQSSGEWIQQPASLLARVENRILPQYESSFQQDKGHLMPFSVSVSSPEKAGILSIVTIAEDSKSDLIESAHRHVLSDLEDEQNRLLDAARSSLKKEIADIEAVLEEVRGGDSSASYAGELYRRRAQLTSDLNSMEPGEVINAAQRSLRPVGPNRKLVVVGSVVGGIFFGIVLAFLSDFVSRVRSALRN